MCSVNALRMPAECRIILALFLLPQAASQLQFTTRYQGETMTGLVGSSVNFTWSFSGDVRRVKWGLKDAQVNDLKTNGKLISLDKTGTSLSIPVPPAYTGRVSGSRSSNSVSGQAIFTLRNITKDDEGFYGCVLSPNDPFDSPEFDAVYLLVKEAPTIIHPTATNASYNMASSVNISCTATGKPDPDVRWTYNGKMKGSGPKTAHLTFSRISKEDAGVYTCRANNSAGTTEKHLSLVVKSTQLQFTSQYHGRTVTGLVSSSLNFTWNFSGDVGSVHWGIKEAGAKILSTTLVTIIQSGLVSLTNSNAYNGRVGGSGGPSSGQAIFTLGSITKADEGFYGCKIYPLSDPLNSPQFDYVRLLIEETPSITHPSLVNQSSYNEGSPVNITCKATGKPDPDVRWIHNKQVKSSGRKTARLIFSPIRKADTGMYTCRANNSAGSKQKQLSLIVECK